MRRNPYGHIQILELILFGRIPLGFMFAMIPAAMAVLLITPGRSHYFAHDEVDTAVLMDLPRDGVALVTPQIVGTVGTTETTDRGGIPCEDVMWSSLKGKCLSFTRRSNHHRRATQAAVYFGGQGRWERGGHHQIFTGHFRTKERW
jgi:hypothetical protein